MADTSLGMSGSEGSVTGKDGTPVNSLINKNKAMNEAKELGGAMGESFAGKVKGIVSRLTGSAAGTAPLDGAASPTGTKFVGNVVSNAAYFTQDLQAEPGGLIGKTRMVASTVKNLADTARSGGAGGIGGAVGKGVGAGAAGVGLSLAMSGVNAAINAANARFESGRAGVLEADRMSVLYQQMTGLSQLGVSSQYRMPLTQYRLGAGGINTMMSMEAQTGLSGAQQASSVEALRTLSGYQRSAGESASMIASLASAPTVNRMFMMTGTSLIGPGGTQRSAMSVMQNITKQAGLTNAATLKDALLPGSVTRQKLIAMGLPEEMVTQTIQYAKSNLTYQEKGGTGMYDPSVKDQRKLMGIEENFATQVEETQRLEDERGENFYRRQVDNYATLERQTQTLTRVFGALEDRLSGILGILGSNRIATSITQSVTGSAFGGDPSSPTSDATTTVPVYGGSGKKTINEVKNMSSFREMNPKMQDRILRMMRDNPNVGFGQGVRSSSSQRAMFLQRYRKTSKETNAKGAKNVYWEGSYWEHVSGAPAAPPGRSMHEVGLAADLVGDMDWIVKNAHKYGLKHFKSVNNEPWHVQPVELPNSRKAYEESGSKWGAAPAGAAPYESDSDFADDLDGKQATKAGSHGGVQDDGSTFGSAEPYGNSISQRVSSSISGPFGGRTETSTATPAETSVNKKKVDGSLIRRGQLTGEQVAMLLHKAGFRGQDIVKGVAISERESRWKSTAHNPNRSTGDNSYGLFQINMIEKYAEGRRKSFGIASNEDLFNPETNVRATKQMYDSRKSKGNGWYDWGPYKGKPETYDTDVSKATRIVDSIDFSGDPMGSASTSRAASSTESLSVIGGATFNISPTINMNGGSGDMQKIARELAIMIRREIEIEMMRGN